MCTDAAAGADAAAAVPDAFPGPVTARPAGEELGSAHGGEVGGIAGKRNQPAVGVGVALGCEKRLALRGHLLEDRIGHGVGRSVRDIPGTADLPGQVVIGDPAQAVVKRVARIRVEDFIDDDFGQPGGHRHGHFDVQSRLDLPARAAGQAAGAINIYILQGHHGQTGLAFVADDVGRGIAVKFDQGDGLAGTGKSDAGEVGIPEIVSLVEARHGGTVIGAGGSGRSLPQRRGLHMRMRPGEIIQAGDAQDAVGEGQGRFVDGGIESAGFGRMPVNFEVNIQRPLDIRRRAGDIQNHMVGVGADDLEALGGRERLQGFIITFGGAELGGEFAGLQIVPVAGTGGIGDVPQQLGENVLMAQRQADGQLQAVRPREIADGGQPADHRRHVAGQGLQYGGGQCAS